ncbi:MAG: SUMF1/EgtB/PvdO family nonheme iron enzyme [Deltaproteobacteria bacterium]|nr:SUMF1/EgtB/PvdO family nonheme iron enzyme [Deltaproteobacteria bacterium]
MADSPRVVRVFISYSHDSELHSETVRFMATRIKHATPEDVRFEVFLDQFVEPRPTEWPPRIEREYRKADVVLCVCTPTYVQRVDGGSVGSGLGATQEGRLIRKEMYELGGEADRIRAVLIEDTAPKDGTAATTPDALGGGGAHLHAWPSKHEPLVTTIAHPTRRRRLTDAFEAAFGASVDALEVWASTYLTLGGDEVTDFDARAREAADRILRLPRPSARVKALSSIAALAGPTHRAAMEAVAQELRIGALTVPTAGLSSSIQPSKAVPARALPTTAAAPSPVTPDELARYLRAAEARYSKVRLVGFDITVRQGLNLDDLYVPLEAVVDRGLHGHEALCGDEHATAAHGDPRLAGQRREIALHDAFAQDSTRRGVVLLGDPGSGKTTHLKQVLLKVIRDGPESIGLPVGTVPIFLSLRDAPKHAIDLRALIQTEVSGPAHNVEGDLGQRLCKRGRLLLLLDGLDEVADAGQRESVARWIETISTDAPDCYFVVSCRYAGYTAEVALDDTFLELHLRPLDDARMQTFVKRWYAEVEKASLVDPEEAARQAQLQSDDLLEALADTEFTAVARVYAMTRNPLLLTAICLVHRDRGRLPKARAELYDQCIKVLLERWKTRLPEPMTPEEARQVMQPVAGWMHAKDKRTRATAAELKPAVERGLSTVSRVTMGAEKFLKSIRDDSGLLTGWGPDSYGFMHLGFQEYLTAGFVRREAFRKPRKLWRLAERFGDSWWREVILLLVALRDPPVFEEFMRVVVRQPGFATWWDTDTMRDCLAEASVVSERPFVEVLTTADDGAAELQLRQLAALRLMARRMPEVLVGLDGVLREHPALEVRRWWVERGRQQELGGEVITAKRGGYALVKIPGGRFMMGSPEDEKGRDVYPEEYLKALGYHPEGPQHELELSSFYLGQHPVTNAEYREYLKANPDAPKPEHWGDGRYHQDGQPVVGVSWVEAKAYCDWAGLLLPTEAQWEYACRAGTQTRFYSGDDDNDLARVGWYAKNSEMRLHVVGELEPNEFGLYDMHGNVWEWCLDAHEPYTTRARDSDGLRKQPVGDANRVIRGGSWINDADYARSACRDRSRPDYRNQYLGFRAAQGHP